MFQLNLNFFVLLSTFTAVLSMFFVMYSLFVVPFRRASFTFTILSFVIFIMSLSNIFMLQMMDYQTALSWTYPLVFCIYFMPISLFMFISEFFENWFSKLNIFLKAMAYLPAVGFVLWTFLSGHINATSSIYGFVIDMPHSDIIDIVYFMPVYIVIALMIVHEFKKNSKANKSNRTTTLLLIVVGIFFLAYIIYRLLIAYGIVITIPVISLLSFFIYIFTTAVILSIRMNVEGLSMRGIFENVEDCIFITDNSGRIVDLNESMYHKLFGETAQLSMKKVMDGDVKLVLSERIKDKDSYQNLFKNIEEDSSEKFNANIDCSFSKEDRTYSVHVSPLTVGGKERIGKLAIFRDITEIQELQNKLREQSIKDFITDIYNIRYFYDALGKNIHMFNRYNNPFCLLIVDVDNFKKFNDSKGHLKGDELLKATADVLKSNIRDDIDVASRYGGDEFAVILVNTSLQDAEEIARRIIEQYNKMSFDDISLSIGVSQYKEGMSREDIIKSADEAMYRAKAAGGNNVISK